MNDSSDNASEIREPGSEPSRPAAPTTQRGRGSPPPRALSERLRRPLMWGMPLLLVAVGAYIYLTSGRYQSTDDAYLRAAQVQISSDVSARVSQIDVRDNQRVHRGQVLFRLGDRSFRIAVQAARARLAAARLQIKTLEADYRASKAALRSAESESTYATREYRRQRRLLAIGVASRSQLDRARLAQRQALQGVVAARQQIAAALARLGGAAGTPVREHPQVAEARAALDHALLELSYTTVRAPTDGIVTGVEHLQVGGYLTAATPAFVLVSTRDVWVEADFKENQLTHIRPGDKATVSIDAYPGRSLHAVVASIRPGTGAQFSVLPPQNATGNWVKVVQRLGVRLRLLGRLPQVRSGLSAVVTVDTRTGTSR